MKSECLGSILYVDNQYIDLSSLIHIDSVSTDPAIGFYIYYKLHGRKRMGGDFGVDKGWEDRREAAEEVRLIIANAWKDYRSTEDGR